MILEYTALTTSRSADTVEVAIRFVAAMAATVANVRSIFFVCILGTLLMLMLGSMSIYPR